MLSQIIREKPSLCIKFSQFVSSLSTNRWQVMFALLPNLKQLFYKLYSKLDGTTIDLLQGCPNNSEPAIDLLFVTRLSLRFHATSEQCAWKIFPKIISSDKIRNFAVEKALMQTLNSYFCLTTNSTNLDTM